METANNLQPAVRIKFIAQRIDNGVQTALIIDDTKLTVTMQTV